MTIIRAKTRAHVKKLGPRQENRNAGISQCTCQPPCAHPPNRAITEVCLNFNKNSLTYQQAPKQAPTHKMQLLCYKNYTLGYRRRLLASRKSWVTTQSQIIESVVFAKENMCFWRVLVRVLVALLKEERVLSFKRAASTRTSTHTKSAICCCKNHMFGEVGRVLVGACTIDRHPSRSSPGRGGHIVPGLPGLFGEALWVSDPLKPPASVNS